MRFVYFWVAGLNSKSTSRPLGVKVNPARCMVPMTCTG